MNKECDCAVHLVIVLERIHVIVFHQRAFKLIVQRIIGHIADSEHVHAVHVQAVDKLCAGYRVCRGNKNIINSNAFLCLADNSSFLFIAYAANRANINCKTLGRLCRTVLQELIYVIL